MSRGAQLEDKESQLNLIGITAWGIVANRSELIKKRVSFILITETRPLKNVPVKSGVPIRLCEQKRSFKDYRRFRSLMNFIAVNYSHTFKRQCRNSRSRLPLF